MTELDNIKDPGLRALIASGAPIGFGSHAQLAAGHCTYAVRWVDPAFKVYRGDEAVAGVFASWGAVCAETRRIVSAPGRAGVGIAEDAFLL